MEHHVKLTDSDVKKLLKGEQVLYKLKSKAGKDYDGLVSITGVNGKMSNMQEVQSLI